VNAKTRRRGFKSWFVEPFQQVKLGLMFLLVNLFFGIMIIGLFGYYVYEIFEVVSTYFKLSGSESIITMQKFAVPMAAGVGLILLFGITTILVSVRYTHEIYGPLVSIHRFLDEVLAGKAPSRIQLRETDQLGDLVDKLNNLAERFGDDQRTGPMVSIHRFLDQVIEGRKPEPLNLRGGDAFYDLADKLNTILADKGK
jgi:hypothetical protein